MFAFRAILMIPIFVYIFTQMLSVPPPHNSAIVVTVYLAWTREFYFDNFLYHFQRSTLYARTTSIYFCMEISKWLCRCACSPVFGQRSRLRLFWRVWNAHLARYHAVSCRRSSPPASSSPKRHRSLALNKNTLLSVVFNGVFFCVAFRCQTPLAPSHALIVHRQHLRHISNCHHIVVTSRKTVKTY